MAEIQARDYTQGSKNALNYSKSLEPLSSFFDELIKNRQEKQLLAQKGEQESSQRIEAVKQLKALMDSAPEGSGASVGNGVASFTKPTNYVAAQRKEGHDLDTAAQKSLGSTGQQLQQIQMMHSLLDNPSSIDAQQLGAGFARITEGQGQRLLQSLVESLGAPKDVVTDSQKAINFLTASAQSPVGSAQHNAMRQNLFKHAAVLENQINEGHDKFLQRGSLIAPSLDSSKYEQAWNSASPSPALLQGLHQRQADFNKQMNSPPAQAPQQAMQPTSLVDKLTSYFRPGSQGPSPTPTQNTPMQPPQSPQGPQAPQGAAPPQQNEADEFANFMKNVYQPYTQKQNGPGQPPGQ